MARYEVLFHRFVLGRTCVESDKEEEKSCTLRQNSRFKNNCVTEIRSGSEAGSCVRLKGFVYHSTLGLRVIKKKKKKKKKKKLFAPLVLTDIRRAPPLGGLRTFRRPEIRVVRDQN